MVVICLHHDYWNMRFFCFLVFLYRKEKTAQRLLTGGRSLEPMSGIEPLTLYESPGASLEIWLLSAALLTFVPGWFMIFHTFANLTLQK